MSDGTNTNVASGLQSTGSGALANTATVSFNNSTGFAISEFRIFAMNANGISEELTYIHITGTIESGGSSEIPENVKENIFTYTQGQQLKVDSDFEATVEVYSFDGKQVLNENVTSGLNTYTIYDKGMYIVVIRNKNGVLVKRSKVMMK